VGLSMRGAMLASKVGSLPAVFTEVRVAGRQDLLTNPGWDLRDAWLLGVQLAGILGLDNACLEGAIALDETYFPDDFDATGAGVHLVRRMPESEAMEVMVDWSTKHARPYGWSGW